MTTFRAIVTEDVQANHSRTGDSIIRIARSIIGGDLNEIQKHQNRGHY